MSNCKHDCEKPPVFPKTISNRPALDQIDYRIGTYSAMREHMLDLLNKDPVLQAWTHRGNDDPGIALLEANAMVGDVLTFYQNLYANQAYLRSADWRDSIADLVQLSGYRLAPGVGGEAVFAVTVKGESAVSVPAGFGFKAQLNDRDQADEFESDSAITAYPHLGAFHLYSPPKAAQTIAKNKNQLELHSVGGSNKLADLEAVNIKQGDRMMLVPDSSMFDNTGTVYSTQSKPEILIVADVETVLNRIIITFEGTLRINRGSNIRAFVIDRTFRHFGYNAPRKLTAYDGISVTVSNTNFERRIAYTHSGSDSYSSLSMLEMPLDIELDDLALGGKLICEGISDFEDGTISSTPQRNNQAFIVVKTIEAVNVNSLQWGNIEASTTVVSIDSKLMTNENIWDETTDIRQTRFHEAASSELSLRAVTEFEEGDFSDGKLEFFGKYDDVKALAERDLLLVDAVTETIQSVRTTSTLTDFEMQLSSDRDDRDQWMWEVTLDQVPVFKHIAFTQDEPAITVYGNLVKATQGKTQAETVLGSGNNREIFQTFAIPKTPLTYLLDETRTPAQTPELDIYINGILWEKVDTFFNSGPDDAVYVIREDQESKSYVQFGDGKTGARLPSGKNNIVAVYRTGIGATGVLKAGEKAKATGKLKELDKAFLPGEVVGGDEAEDGDNAREAAPGKMQSLGRLVGLADFEAEALTLPGVLKVRADWAAPTGVPLIRIVVLTETGTAAATAQLQTTLNGYNRCRGAARFPLLVEQGNLQYVYISIRVGYDATYRVENVETAVKLALGLSGEEDDGIESETGLFSLKQRYFGQDVHRSQILAAAQQTEGVTWVEINDAQALDLGSPVETDPLALATPAIASTSHTIACMLTRVLALHTTHFDITLVVDATAGECDA